MGRVKAESRAWSISFLQVNDSQAQPKSSTVSSTVGQDFDAKLRNCARRTAKAKRRITWRQQRYAKQWNAAQPL